MKVNARNIKNIKNVVHTYGNYKFVGKKFSHEQMILSLFETLFINHPEIIEEFSYFVTRYYYLSSSEFIENMFLNFGNFEAYLVQNLNYYEYLLNLESFNILGTMQTKLNEATYFADMVLDFLVRCQDYTIIQISGQKIIITSRYNCEKELEDYILDGYTIQKRGRLKYLGNGKFEELRALPSKSDCFVDEEMIETEIGTFEKVYKPYDCTKKNLK